MEDNQTPPAAPQSSEFFPNISKPAPVAADAAPAQSNDWYIMDGLKGEGERPSYFSPKYKTLLDQAKAYPDLEKKLGATRIAPEKYDISKYEHLLNPEDMVTQKLLHTAREKQLPQDALDGVLDVFSEYVNVNKIDPVKELEKLGPNGREKVKVVAQWVENTFSEKAIEALNRLPKNADFVNFMDEVRQLQHHTSVTVPIAPESKFVPLTVGEVEAEMRANYARYNSDAKYRAEIKAKFAQALGE